MSKFYGSSGYKDLVENILDNDLKEFRSNYPSDITDRVFLVIEEKYLGQYNHFYDTKGDRINILIGKHIREYWSLLNTGRCKYPNSTLIRSYEMHSN